MNEAIKYFKYAMLAPLVLALAITFIFTTFLSQSSGYVLATNLNQTNSNIQVQFNKESSYTWPTSGFTGISSYFGRRVSPTEGASTFHQGVDILANQGTNVKAFDGGIVIFAGFDNSGGYMVRISHTNEITTSYCHLSENIHVKKGEKIQAGQVIGSVGPKYIGNGKRNGATTGVHLHFAVTINNVAVDPLEFIYNN